VPTPPAKSQKTPAIQPTTIISPSSFRSRRSSFLIDELHLGDLSETVVVVSNAPHDRPCGLVCHLIGNRASFLCTKAPMVRIPNELSLTSTCCPSGRSLVVLEKPSSLLIAHDGLIHFDEHPLDHRLRQPVPLQCLIIECLERHQHFELCERCLPKVLV